jgi:hypothetical protein
MLNNVLLARVIDGKYVFETKANNSTAKTYAGAFEEPTIDNDILELSRHSMNINYKKENKRI